jgi:hypothetical protein
VIDMRNDAEISLELWVHVPVVPGRGGKGPSAGLKFSTRDATGAQKKSAKSLSGKD